MYLNQRVYGTPFPMFGGFLLMLAGTWDWDMAMKFSNERSPDLTSTPHLSLSLPLSYRLTPTYSSYLSVLCMPSDARNGGLLDAYARQHAVRCAGVHCPPEGT